MSTLRIQFTRLHVTEPAKLRSWADHAERLVGSLGERRPIDEGGVVWHLTSANHRTIARSAGIHSSFESAYETVLDVRRNLDRVVARSVSAQLAYGWYGTLDTALVITCARLYSTVRDARDSLRDTLGAFETAPIEDAPRQLAGHRGGR